MFRELGVGNTEAAVAVPLIVVLAAILVLLLVRFFGRPSLLAEGAPK